MNLQLVVLCGSKIKLSMTYAAYYVNSVQTNYGRFAYESFRLLSVRLRLQSFRLRPICQFAYA